MAAHQKELDNLLHYLKNLPPSVPAAAKIYSFSDYVPDDERVADYGSEQGDLNAYLEVTFGSRHQGHIQFKEKGPNLEAVVPLLRKYINGESKEEVLLLKWVEDLTKSAIALCEAENWNVKRISKPTQKRAAGEEEKEESRKKKQVRVDTKTAQDAALKRTAQNVTFNFENLEDDPITFSDTGHPRDGLLDELSRPCHIKDQPEKKRYRCTAINCQYSWAHPRAKSRILNHAINDCKSIDPALKKRAAQESSRGSLGAQVDLLNSRNAAKPDKASAQLLKSQKSVEAIAKAEGQQQKNKRFNLSVLNLLCVSMIPPSIVDLKEWEDMVTEANSSLSTYSSTTFSENYIPREASRVHELSVQHLKRSSHLTISFDGGTTRRKQSIYTVHVTDPINRDPHLMAGDSASGVSHTGEHIKDVLLKVINEIGPTRFSGISSDSTGNTKLAREKVVEKYPFIIILADPCHHLNNAAKDICSLDCFAKCIANCRSILQYFNKSTFANHHLTMLRQKMGINEGLVSVGNTRFLTLYYASASVLRCLPAIKELLSTNVIQPKKETGIAWMKSKKDVRDFEDELNQLKEVLEPLARSVTCLESTQSHPGDVYLFWLAVMASFSDIFENKNIELELKDSDINNIRSILNFRYTQMIDGPSQQVYLSCVFLNYEYLGSVIFKWKNSNPLNRKIHIACVSKATADLDLEVSDYDLRKSLPAYEKVGSYLLQVLQHEINADIAIELFDAYEDAESIISTFRAQFMNYTRQVRPFDYSPDKKSIQKYWEALSYHPDASILSHLAIKLFSLLPNSMAEERTVSAFTKLNAPDRSRQKAETLVNMTKVRQHILREKVSKEGSKARTRLPLVKFHDLSKYLSSRKEQVLSGTSEVINAGSVSKPINVDLPDNANSRNEAVGREKTMEVSDEIDEDLRAHAMESDSWANNKPYTPDGQSFDIEEMDGVNLNAPLLREFLSDSSVSCSNMADESEEDQREARPKRRMEKKVVVGTVHF